MLFPKADIARDTLPEELRAAGAEVTEVVAYRTVTAESDAHLGIYRQLLDRRIDAVTFSSASAVRAFVSIYGADQAVDLLSHTTVATIGPVTADAALRYGITPQITPATSTMPALVDALVAHFASRCRASHMKLDAAAATLAPHAGAAALVRETRLSRDQFILPLFVCEGGGVRREVSSMPGVSSALGGRGRRPRLPAAWARRRARPCCSLACRTRRTTIGSAAYDPDGPVHEAVRAHPRGGSPSMVVITDVCLCEYTSHGHCGIVADGDIANDATVEQLVRAAVSHAEAGAHIVAPSDMMDGRVGAIRQALDAAASTRSRSWRTRQSTAPGSTGRFARPPIRRRSSATAAAIRWIPPTPKRRCAKWSSTSPKAPTS